MADWIDMPRPLIRYNNTKNTNASVVTNKEQARTIYANALVSEKTINNNCLNRVVAGPSAATSYSASKITDQRLGAVFTTVAQQADIIASSPCEVTPGPIVYPNYELTCSDPLGIQIMATGTFTSFTFTTTSLGAGCLDFQFFLNNSFVSNQFVVLGIDSNIITPPPGIDEVRYVFKCNPIVITIDCSGTPVALQYTNPYSFYNPSGYSVTLTLTKYPVELGSITQVVEAGQTFTPTPSWGWYLWSIPCPGSLAFPGSANSQLFVDAAPSLVLGAGDFTIEWYQYYANDTTNNFPTIFAYGTFNYDLDVEVYIENINNNIWFTEPNSFDGGVVASISEPYRDTWCHFAVCRSGGILYIYQNGILLGSGPSSYNFSNDTLPLTIGSEETTNLDFAFKGKITSFRLTIGNALYPDVTTFTPPTVPLPRVSGTQLLLDVNTEATYITDSSAAARTVTNYDVVWSPKSPLTPEIPSVVSSTFVPADFNTNMTFTGDVISENGSTITDWGVVWNTSGTPTINDNKVPVADLSANPIGTYTVTYNAMMDVLNYARAYATNGIGTAYGTQLTATPQICLAKGTMITLADYSQKPIESIDYTDEILVWNFDDACFATSKPLWIKQTEKAARYNLLEFSDGSRLKTINQHRIFNKQAGKFTYPMTGETPLGTITWNSKGNEIYLVSKRTIIESVEYYNVITEYHINLFANGILTSCRYNNIYPIADMKFQKVTRPIISQSFFPTVPDKYYSGLRLAEQRISIQDTLKYIERLESKKK